MPGLVPGIHDFFFVREHVDGRDKPGHDGRGECELLSAEALALAPRHLHPRFILFSTRSLTTAGSASVLVSPSWVCSLAAILRKIRRMIFPERVFGNPGAH